MVYRYRPPQQKVRERIFLLIAAVIAVVVIATIVSTRTQTEIGISLPLGQASISDLSTEGFVKVTPSVGEITAERGLVGLTAGCIRVSAGTEPSQAESIQKGLEGRIGPRPNTHDLTKDAFNFFGIKVLMVKVVDLKESNFIGRLILQQGNNIVSLDSRPSDGIALALRTNSTIYFNETLLKERGENIC